jgi:hypothetical protein
MTTIETRREARIARKRAELVGRVKSLRDAWMFFESNHGLLDAQVTVEPGVEDSVIEAADDLLLLDVIRAADDVADALQAYENALDRLVKPEPEEDGEDVDVVIE